MNFTVDYDISALFYISFNHNFYRILSDSGEVLAYSGNDEKNIVDILSAVASNMWLTLSNSGEAALNEEQLSWAFFKCTVSFRSFLGFDFCIRPP